MISKSSSATVFTNTITSDDILGKEVIDSEGAFLGIVEKIHFTAKVELVGISIDRGFLKKGFSIGIGYINRVTPYALFLNIRPSFLLKGMQVFDNEGANVGVVQEVVLREGTNALDFVFVRIGLGKRIRIQEQLINEIGEGVFLNQSKSALMASLSNSEEQG